MPLAMTTAQVEATTASYEELLFLAIAATRRNAALEDALQAALDLCGDVLYSPSDFEMGLSMIHTILSDALEEEGLAGV